MSRRFFVPADARARSKMLAAHLEESARKLGQKSQQRWQATHLKVPPVHGHRSDRPTSG
jgi:hypothetical protein